MMSWSPGRTGLRHFTLSQLMKKRGLALRRRSRRSIRMPAACAIASSCSTPGMTGLPGIVALEIRLVDRDVLDRDELVLADELDHAVDHHERIAVRQRVEDAADIERGLGRRARPCGARLGRLLRRPFSAPRSFSKSALVSSALIAWPGPRGDDVRLERHAEQHDVADDIEDLVAHELVLEAQRLLRDDLVALDDDGAVERAALDLAQLEQLLDVLVDREGARRRDLRHVDLRVDRRAKGAACGCRGRRPRCRRSSGRRRAAR